MESLHTSVVEARESALIWREYGVHEASLSCCAEIGVPLDLRRVSQGISGVA